VEAVTRTSLSASTQIATPTLLALVSTIPGSAEMRLESKDLLMLQQVKPVVLDATYMPAETSFLQQCAQEYDVPRDQIIRGLDLLIAQGFFGMEAWIGKTLPAPCKQEMEAAVRAAYAQQQAAASSSK
jgi:shikimate 5-dehydrogenase